MSGMRRLPSWLRMERASGESYTMVKRLVEDNAFIPSAHPATARI